MPLSDRFSHPPGHFVFREPKTGMVFGEDGLGFYEVSEALFKHRSSNPRIFSADERTLQACEKSVEDYTCKRLGKNRERWCYDPNKPSTASTNDQPKVKKSPPEKGCASCGRRKKRG